MGRLPIPLVGFANLAHMGAYHYMPACFVKLSFKFEKKMRIGGNTGQLTDSGESVMRIGGNTGQLIDSPISHENRWEHRSID